MKVPCIRYQAQDWRIVRVQIPPQQREPKQPGELEDDGYRDLIEVLDGKDLMGNPRWSRLEKKAEGVGTYDRICHGLKRALLELIDDVEVTDDKEV